MLLAYTDASGNKFRRSNHDPCVFTKGALGSNSYITLSIHIDDKFIACTSERELNEFKGILDRAQFQYRVEHMQQVLGMKVTYTPHTSNDPNSGTITLDHSQFITAMYNEFKTHFDPPKRSVLSTPMTVKNDKRTSNTPSHIEFDKERYKLFRSILGKVSHVANFTHPEIATAVSLVSRNMANPTQHDLFDVFDIVRYLMGTVNNKHCILTLHYNPNFDANFTHSQNPVHICCDADLSNDTTTKRSRTGFCGYLFGNLVGWCSRRQPSVSLSTAESEYMAISASAQFAKWYKGLVADMGLETAIYEPIVILTDSKSAQQIANSDVARVNKYSKHISQRVHWFRELIRDKVIRVNHLPGEDNQADIFTKVLGKTKFRKCRDRLLQGDRRVLRDMQLTCITKFHLSLPCIDTSSPWPPAECECHGHAYQVIHSHAYVHLHTY